MVTEDIDYEFVTNDITYVDVDLDDFSGIEIETLPVTGNMYYLGEEIIVTGDIIEDIGNLTYVPLSNDNSGSEFVYRVYDGVSYSTQSYTMELQIEAINDAPEAESLEVSVNEGASINIELVGTDIDGDEIVSYEIVSSGSYGELTQTDELIIYTHGGGGETVDYIIYTVSDGELKSEEAIVTIDIIKDDRPTVSSYEIEVEV